MVLSLLLPLELKRQGRTRIGIVTFDAVLQEQHNASAMVTMQPVEEGSFIADHIVRNPETVSITGIISNTPLRTSLDRRLSIIDNAQRAFDDIYKAWSDKELVTVITHYRRYTDMAITDISVPRDRNTGDAINLTVTLQKVRKARDFRFDAISSTFGFISGPLSQAREVVNKGRRLALNTTDNVIQNVNDVLRGIF